MSWRLATVPSGSHDRPPGDAVAWHSIAPPVHGSDDDDHWFTTSVTADGDSVLRLGGLATVCDVYVDGKHVLRSESMFREHELPLAPGPHELAICARALTPLLAEQRKPRARWRTRVVANGNLRWFRTALYGRAPAFAPGPPIVGPWRPVELVDPSALRAEIRTSLDGHDGLVAVRTPEAAGPIDVLVDGRTTELPAGGGTVRVTAPALWWPHTHGEPVLHDVEIRSEHSSVSRRVGFRDLAHADDVERDGLALRVNGIPVFARGAVWVPTAAAEVRATLERLRDGGMNMVRVVGTMVYESAEFYDACDELGLLVWQDLMFSNMDYPFVDASFRALAEAEVEQALERVAGRPSLAVLCGNSEVEQQVAMLGLPADLARDEFFVGTAPELARAAGIDAAYVPSAPTGTGRPFRTDSGVANYFGVGAYLRPLADVRSAAVKFASECLAFAHVPDSDPADRTVGVRRDSGADWDFADVRDHYLRTLHGAVPGDEDYWELSRHVSGEVSAAVFGEWRRAESPCTGGIVLWSRDLEPGSGWGLLDSEGRPKAAWHHLRRALAPVAVWFVDEGLNGLAVHAANDTASPLDAVLRVSLYRDGAVPVGGAEIQVALGPHALLERDVEDLLGRFVDVGYAYRFGPPQQDVVVATLERDGERLAEAVHFPVPLARKRRPAADLGLEAHAARIAGGVELTLSTTHVVRGVRVRADGLDALDDAFHLAPGPARRVVLRGDGRPAVATVTGLDLAGVLEVPVA